MIDPNEIMHPIPIQSEFKEELKRHLNIDVRTFSFNRSNPLTGVRSSTHLCFKVCYDDEVIEQRILEIGEKDG